MITTTQEKILQLMLSKPEEPLSIRGIARRLGKSYTLTYNNIQALLKKKILESRVVPPARIMQINKDAPTNLLINIERKRAQDFLEKNVWMRLYVKDVLRAAKPFFIMIIFGSYAKETQTRSSDVDLLLIVPTRDDIALYEKTAEQYTKAKKNITIVDAENFQQMIKNPKEFNVGNESVKHHVILYGAEQYYLLVADA